MVKYKPHYACFRCRKTFKRMLMWDINRDDKRKVPAKCPDCAGPVADMGKDFEAPPRKDTKAWSHLETLHGVGITFHSCGCSGPGYIPRDREALVAHLAAILAEYHKHLEFWRTHEEPATKAEADRDRQRNWAEVSRTPPIAARPRTGSRTLRPRAIGSRGSGKWKPRSPWSGRDRPADPAGTISVTHIGKHRRGIDGPENNRSS